MGGRKPSESAVRPAQPVEVVEALPVLVKPGTKRPVRPQVVSTPAVAHTKSPYGIEMETPFSKVISTSSSFVLIAATHAAAVSCFTECSRWPSLTIRCAIAASSPTRRRSLCHLRPLTS
jgi:hypothetical protein